METNIKRFSIIYKLWIKINLMVNKRKKKASLRPFIGSVSICTWYLYNLYSTYWSCSIIDLSKYLYWPIIHWLKYPQRIGAYLKRGFFIYFIPSPGVGPKTEFASAHDPIPLFILSLGHSHISVQLMLAGFC